MVFKKILAEIFGTFLLVFFGVGVVQTAILTGAQVGLWQIAAVWGVAIMVAIYCVGSISGAHINPAITVAMCCFGKHRWSQAVPYIGGQFVGAFVAAAVLYGLFAGHFAAKETEKQVVRGEPGSIVTATCFGEYFPNPGSFATSEGPFDQAEFDAARSKVTLPQALLAETLGTAILAIVVFAVTDPRNAGGPGEKLAPVFIGLTVSILISVIAPLTQACFNPARDFGPRIFAWLAGWGKVAWPMADDLSWLTVYILAPIAGAVAGGAVYQFLLATREGEQLE